MTLLGKFFRLDGSDRWLLVRCACLLAAMRVALFIVPIRRLHASFAAREPDRAVGRYSPEQIAWAIRSAARLVPGASCLPRALAAQLMLRRHGHAAQLRIGIARTEDGALTGHAWVDSDVAVALGGDDPLRYTAVPLSETPHTRRRQ